MTEWQSSCQHVSILNTSKKGRKEEEGRRKKGNKERSIDSELSSRLTGKGAELICIRFRRRERGTGYLGYKLAEEGNKVGRQGRNDRGGWTQPLGHPGACYRHLVLWDSLSIQGIRMAIAPE